jgi:hypothetical protein
MNYPAASYGVSIGSYLNASRGGELVRLRRIKPLSASGGLNDECRSKVCDPSTFKIPCSIFHIPILLSNIKFFSQMCQVRKHIFWKITEIKLQCFKRFWNVLGKVLFLLDPGKEAECP